MVYQSEDEKFSLNVNSQLHNELLKYVSAAGNKETGGILIGSYNESKNIALVKQITGPPTDSRYGRTWFERGLNGLQKLLTNSWKIKQYYLGEWHFHPGGSPDPSSRDKNQMADISTSKQYHCPEPVLFIIGGWPDNYEIKTFVALPDRKLIELYFRD